MHFYSVLTVRFVFNSLLLSHVAGNPTRNTQLRVLSYEEIDKSKFSIMSTPCAGDLDYTGGIKSYMLASVLLNKKTVQKYM